MSPRPLARVSAYQHGIYPRSESLVAVTRDLERQRTTPEAVDQRFQEERGEVLELQREAGLDYLSDGLLRWQDIFRPLVEASEGLEARVLVRWFDNNSFYRAPNVTSAPRLEGALPGWLVEDGVPEPRAATLPSPFLFSRAAHDGGDRDRLMVALARDVLRPAVTAMTRIGYRLIHLQEPWLPYNGIEDDSWPAFEEALLAIREGAGDAALVLHTYFGDAGPFVDRLRRLPVDAVGIDFVETDLESLGGRWDTGLVIGCLDGRRSVLEPVDRTVAFVLRVAEALEPPALLISSGSDLELLPTEVARRKVLLLGEVAATVKESLP